MSGIAIIKALLDAEPTVAAAVPVAKIKGGTLPQAITAPAIAINLVSGVDRNIVKPRTVVRVTDRIQVTVIAADFPTLQSIMRLVRKACRDKRAAVGYVGVQVVTDGKGPDGLIPGTGIHMQTQDFMVSYSETP